MARNATQPTKPARGGPSKAKREEIVKAAQSAWHAIMSGAGDRWSYWQEVCPALALARDDAMREIGLDPRTHETPTKNGRYNNAMTRALKAIDLHQIPKSSRKAAIEVAPHLTEITAWRETLRVSTDEKERQQYLGLSHPQKVWADFKKWMGWQDDKEGKEKKFVDYKVKDALGLPDNSFSQNLAVILPPGRIYSIAASLLSRLEVPMRPVLADSLEVPSNARQDTVLAVLDKLAWDTSERSRLADAIEFDRPKRNSPIPAEASPAETAAFIGTQLGYTDETIRELAEMLLTRIGETQSLPHATSTAWGDPDAVAQEMAELRERLRRTETELARQNQLLAADVADPLTKEIYRDFANEATHQRQESLERIRQLEADRDQWRLRIRTEIEAQHAAHAAAVQRERDQAVVARDKVLIELEAARTQIVALTSRGGRDDSSIR